MEIVGTLSKQTLDLSPDVSLLPAFVTSKLGIFGMSGSGKTHNASVLAEELLWLGVPLVIIDPLGVWYGLRVFPDGVTLPQILIIGGDHADLPLLATSGAAIADLVVDEKLSVILDLSNLTQEEQTQFAAAFCKQLYHRSRSAVHIIVDECDIFAPETPGSNSEWESRRALDTIVRRGRVRGLGITLITQRPAVVAKSLVSQVGMLAIHRLAAESDRKAIDGWIKSHGTEEQRKAIMGSLASLTTGEAWFWSPELGLFVRTRVRRRVTFDSSATPEVGIEAIRAEPRPLTSAALDLLRARLATQIEKAEETDVTLLQARIVQLKRQIADGPKPERIEVPVERVVEKIIEKRVEVPVEVPVFAEIEERVVEVPVFADDDLNRLEALRDSMIQAAKELTAQADVITARLDGLFFQGIDAESSTGVLAYADAAEAQMADAKPTMPTTASMPVSPVSPVSPPSPAPLISLVAEERRLLDALADYPTRQLTYYQLSVRAKIALYGASWDACVKNLLALGLIIRKTPNYIQITVTGLLELEKVLGKKLAEPNQTTDFAVNKWRVYLSDKAFLMLRWLVEIRPRTATKTMIGGRFNLSPEGRAIVGYLNELTQLDLAVESKNGQMRSYRAADDIP